MPRLPDAYKAVQVASSDPKMLVILLFESARRYLEQARDAIARRDFETKHKRLTLAQEIFTELQLALDDRPAPELARNLRALYAHLIRTITEANLEDSLEKLDHALHIVRMLENAWKEAAQRCQATQQKS